MPRVLRLIFSLCFLTALAAHAQSKKAPALPDRPRLVVGLMVDQMRWDYLARYSSAYGDGGFKRLLREGFACENTQIDYASTITACGHSSVYTGAPPAIHGITGNTFIDQATGKKLYCTQDDTVSTVGSPSLKAGRMSPRNLFTSTIGDELRLATNSRARVFAVGMKDRGAILPGGHMADGAYWFDPVAPGAWVTSTYYRDALPEWAAAFNREKTTASYLKDEWTALPETLALDQSTADDVPWEIPFEEGAKPVLPVRTSALPNQADDIGATPFGNTMTFDFARELLIHEKLGTDDVTDLLAISLSAPDYVGHRFGPNSVEIQDTYIRLDRELATFLAFLDKTVGKGNYLLFLTSDHGAAHNVQFLEQRRIPAGIFTSGLHLRQLDALLQSRFGQTGIVLGFENRQVSLNRALISSAALDERAIISTCLDFIRTRPGVAYAFEMGPSVPVPDLPEPIRSRVIGAYNPERSGSIQIILKPGWYEKGLPTGTSHGVWSPYDAHIPLVWMGWKIPSGSLYRETHITDIAPTLAALLKIQEPNGSTGSVITEILSPATKR